jgi:hypothetical protein
LRALIVRNEEGQKETSHVLSLQTTLEKNVGELNISIIEIQYRLYEFGLSY